MHKSLIVNCIIFILLIGCSLPTETNETRPSDKIEAIINGVPLSFIVYVSVIPTDGSATIGGAYCVSNRFPRNLNISISLPVFEKGNYNIPKEPYKGEPSFSISDNDGDASTGTYIPTTDSSTILNVESFNSKTGRLLATINGIFELDYSADEEYRYFPDTIYVEKGIIDVSLIPIDDYSSVWVAPCVPAL